MKKILGFTLLLATTAVSASNDWMNEAYGTYEGTSNNYVEFTTNETGFIYSDSLAEAETNGYFTQWEEAVATWNEQNGYWQ